MTKKTKNIEPPQSVEAEQSVLGSLLKDGTVMDDVATVLTSPDMFYVAKHQIIYNTMIKLYNRREPHDLTTVADELVKTSDLEKIGGRLYLIDLIDGCATTANAATYANIILEKYQYRRLIEGMSRLTDASYNQEKPPDELMNDIEGLLLKIKDNSNLDQARKLSVLMMEAVEHLSDKEKVKADFITTRIDDLNKSISGLFYGDLIVIAAPPSMGKTSFVLDLMLYNAAKGKKFLYFALDETSRAVAIRRLSSATRIAAPRFWKGQLSDDEIITITKSAVMTSGEENITVIPSGDITVMDILSVGRRFKRKYGLDGIVIDFIQQLNHCIKYDARRPDIAVEYNVRQLKKIGKELNIVMLPVSQFSREYSKLTIKPSKNLYGFPTLQSMAGSKAIEEEANIILSPHNLLTALRMRGERLTDEYRIEQGKREGVYQRAWICVVKDKLGPGPAVECSFHPYSMQFVNNTSKIQPIQEDMPF